MIRPQDLPYYRQTLYHCTTKVDVSSAESLVCSIFKVPQSGIKLVEMLSEYQTAWVWVRCRVTQRLIQIQAVCIWN